MNEDTKKIYKENFKIFPPANGGQVFYKSVNLIDR